ncbi:MAG: hypothetical protein ACRD4D_05555 [Candidatus Acidiferrales bacterium]
MSPALLNAVYTRRSMRRRYEVWFVRFHLADGSGAWWFRYLLMNPGRGEGGCAGVSRGEPVQVWATWFPREGKPQSAIQGFPLAALSLSARGASPFFFRAGENRIGEDGCSGKLEAEGLRVSWELRWRSSFGATVADWGWIGFSRTAHSDAIVSGSVSFNGHEFAGEPLGFGLQGHNCGFRHRHLWNWTHCTLENPAGGVSTFEALEYEVPLNLRVRRALLWHGGELFRFGEFEELSRDRERLVWVFRCRSREQGATVLAFVDGRGNSLHRLPYAKTDCSGTFEVANNSRARATIYFSRRDRRQEVLSSDGGAVLEMVGGDGGGGV